MSLKMNFVSYIITPFAWLLETFYKLGGNYVVALCLFAIVFKLIMLPSAVSQQKGMAKQQRLQPKIRRIQAKFAGNQQKIQEETQALYAREGYNPMRAGCLPLLIQLPIIYILYEVIYSPLKYVLRISDTVLDQMNKAIQAVPGIDKTALSSRRVQLTMIEHFDQIKGSVTDKNALAVMEDFVENFTFSGVPLGKVPQWSTITHWATSDSGAKLLLLIPIISGVTSLLTGLITYIRQKRSAGDGTKNPASGCMTFTMPLISVYFTFLFPAGIGIYWIFQNILSAIQTLVLGRVYSNEKVLAREMVRETIARRSKEANDKIVAQSRN